MRISDWIPVAKTMWSIGGKAMGGEDATDDHVFDGESQCKDWREVWV